MKVKSSNPPVAVMEGNNENAAPLGGYSPSSSNPNRKSMVFSPSILSTSPSNIKQSASPIKQIKLTEKNLSKHTNASGSSKEQRTNGGKRERDREQGDKTKRQRSSSDERKKDYHSTSTSESTAKQFPYPKVSTTTALCKYYDINMIYKHTSIWQKRAFDYMKERKRET